LFGLRRITLSQTYLRQLVQNLRFARRDTLGALKTGRRTVEIAAALLLLGSGQKRKHWAVQLFVG
jgi:hypothetical protein